MKTKANRTCVLQTISAIAFLLVIVSPLQAMCVEATDGKEMTMPKMMMEQCQEMKVQKQKMADDVKAQAAELTDQIAKMNSAPADQKINLLAAVVTHMAEQRVAMDIRKAKMEEEMMKHMMQHMQMGKESMSQCPMMTGMKDMKDMKDEKTKDGPKEGK